MKSLAIIGCGRISYKHIQAAIDNFRDIRLVAVCDIIEERARERAKQYADAVYKKIGWPDGCEDNFYESGITKEPICYTDYKTMLKEVSLDLIAIATESGFHAQIAIYCMNLGKHVIVEKPMALSTTDADLMIHTSLKNNVKLCVSHQNRFNPAIQKLRQVIEQGKFGKIIAGNARVLWNRNESYYYQAPWRGTYEQDGGCLMNQCIHNIDLLQWMLGSEIKWVNGEVNNFMHPYIEAEDYGSIQIKFKTGAIGNVEGTVCVFPTNLEETLTIIGEKGTVVIGGLAVNKILTWRFEGDLDNEKDIISEYNNEVENVYGSGHTPLYQDMIEAIRQNRRPYIDGIEGKKGMEIILAAYLSSKIENRISYPLEAISAIDFK